MKARIIALLVVILSLGSSSAQADQKAPSPSYLRSKSVEVQKAPIAQKTNPSLERVSIALFLVLSLGVVALYAKRRKRGPSSLRNQIRLHSLGDLSLGPKSKVALLSVGREALLLGVTESGISCLRCYPEDELWSLTAALPGFGDLIREQEEQAKLARRPKSERSVMDRGMDKAFSELLTKAGHSVQPQESRRAPANEKPPLEDEFVPSEVKAGTFGRRVVTSDLDELPPHLVALLAETQDTPTARKQSSPGARSGNVVHFPVASSADAFDAPDGQAAELAKRFSELSS